MKEKVGSLTVTIFGGSVIMIVDFFVALGVWKWVALAIVSGTALFWDELVTEPRAKRKALQMLREWPVQELKALLAERERDNN